MKFVLVVFNCKMEFPNDILALIRAYSKPLTNPKWRQSKPIISTYKLYELSRKKVSNSWKFTRYDTLLDNIKKTDWYFNYITIQDFGLDIYYRIYLDHYGVDAPIWSLLVQIDGLEKAANNHRYMYGSIWGVYR